MANDGKTFSIVAEPREITGKAVSKLRRQRLIPGVVYGPGMKPQSLQVRARDFDQTYLRAGSTQLVDLSVGEGGTSRKVFIHAVQRNPINHQATHIDFVEVNLREEMTVNVPVVLVGESPAVRNGDGALLHHSEHITLKSLPMNIPQLIELDVSGLTEIGQSLYVSDLELPENITLMSNPDDLVVRIIESKVEAEVVEAEEAEEAEAEGEGEAEGGEAGAETGEESAS